MIKPTVGRNRVVRGFVQPHIAVTLFTLLITGCCFALMLFVLERGEQRALRELEDKTQLLAHTLENSVIRSVQDVIGRLQSIEKALELNPALLTQDSPTLNRILLDTLSLTPSLREVMIHGPQRNWVASSRQRPPNHHTQASRCADQLAANPQRGYLIQPPADGRFLGGSGGTDSQQHIPICVELSSADGAPSAWVTAALNPAYLRELFRPAHELNPVTVELYHYDGSLLVRAEDSNERFAVSAQLDEQFRKRLQQREFGTFHQQQRLDQQPERQLDLITSYRSTSQLPLVLLTHLDTERGLAIWQRDYLVVLWIFIALIVAVALGGSLLVVGLLRKHRMENEIRMLTTAISSTANAIFITNGHGQIQWVNQAFARLTGWHLDDVRGQTPRILNSGEHDDKFFGKLWRTILQGDIWRGYVTNKTRDGKHLIIDQTITPIVDQYQHISHFIAIHEDVTARVQAENRVKYLAHHDALTALPNRRAFITKLNEKLELGGNRKLTVLFIDLDNFKAINDTLGHQAGDDVLQISTERMQQVLPGNALLSRLGGDEFAVMLDGISHDTGLQTLLEELLLQLSQPVELGHSHFTLSASIGITFGKPSVDSAASLLKQADLAMYKAKQNGRNTFSFFDDQMDSVMHRHVELEQGMRDALSRGDQFQLCFQPIVNAETLKPVSLEVLMRWRNSRGEWISPAEFIPVAEDVGLILELGRWQLSELFKRLRSWHNTELAQLRISINISTVQLARDRIANELINQLERNRISPRQLVVEITETTLMTDSTLVRENLQLLHQHGIELSIDDFGTGHSSLSYISELNAGTIKIDQSFISGIGNHTAGQRNSDEAVIMATIALARNLGLKVVAEGVETERQQRFLQHAGADLLQGYRFAKPMFEPTLIDYLNTPRQPLKELPAAAEALEY